MAVSYAEVIGDPVAHSKSPLIHTHWLRQLGIEGDYRATRVASRDLAAYLDGRRSDPDWRGCNVTIPHKEAILSLLDSLAPSAEAVGAVNCVAREGPRLIGHNSDIDGIAAALDPVPLDAARVAIVGAGGAARAAVHYLRARKAGTIAFAVREPARAAALATIAAPAEVHPLERAAAAFAGAALIVNASPMGMTGAAPMPDDVVAAASECSKGTAVFDMVYNPLETELLATARASGAVAIDGLTMLIGQAASAFELFFGAAPPEDTAELRARLAAH